MNATYTAPSTRRRRRRWPIVLVIFVVLVGAILAAADRVAVSLAQDRVATRLSDQRPFSGRPTVRIHGFPFLTQSIDGKYRDIDVTGLGEPLAGMTGAHVHVELHGAHIPLSAVRTHVQTVPVDRVEVTITVPVSQLALVAGVPNLKLTSQNGNLVAQAPVSLPGLGSVTLSATVHLTITHNGLDGTVTDVRAFGSALPSSVAELANQALHLHVALPNLGFDSAAATVVVVGSNVVFTGSARNVVLR